MNLGMSVGLLAVLLPMAGFFFAVLWVHREWLATSPAPLLMSLAAAAPLLAMLPSFPRSPLPYVLLFAGAALILGGALMWLIRQGKRPTFSKEEEDPDTRGSRIPVWALVVPGVASVALLAYGALTSFDASRIIKPGGICGGSPDFSNALSLPMVAAVAYFLVLLVAATVWVWRGGAAVGSARVAFTACLAVVFVLLCTMALTGSVPVMPGPNSTSYQPQCQINSL